jgi:dihydrofolate synthase/folylpolyglutamate synthase
MEFADQLLGHPHRKYKIIHVAGTNGKGSVSNMLASVLAACGYKTGLYTSPHILDFRERMRVVTGFGPEAETPCYEMISKQDVWDFVHQWKDTFDHLDMSFFEITTLMALNWFATQKVDYVVLETGLGGRLDSTNIVTPMLSVVTNIGLDHCDMLGDTLPEIAFEKAGIIKPCVPVVIGESHPETDSVFERKVLYTNLSEVAFMGNRTAIMELLTFADKVTPGLWERHEEILKMMDLKGDYQRKNLRTVLAALDVLKVPADAAVVADALINTAARTGFRGRWDVISEDPCIICDIGHNEHGLK